MTSYLKIKFPKSICPFLNCYVIAFAVVRNSTHFGFYFIWTYCKTTYEIEKKIKLWRYLERKKIFRPHIENYPCCAFLCKRHIENAQHRRIFWKKHSAILPPSYIGLIQRIAFCLDTTYNSGGNFHLKLLDFR